MNKCYTPIKIWLYTLVLMVFSMVFVGGVTRLTDSGLSMVNWRPIMGAIPPLTDEEWNHTFDQYKNFPEYQKVNHGMSLSEFKQIFFWEYFHRLLGRMIGIVFFFPFLYFVLKGKLPENSKKKYFFAFILGGLQGLMGWYMVKSGLINRPDVSHFRLAAHLLLAFLIIAYLYWLILELNYPKRGKYDFRQKGLRVILFYGFCLVAQFLFGAFVAGLDAGLTHNTFPKMGNSWVPFNAFTESGFGLLSNPVFVQFVHRCFGLTLILVAIYIFLNRKVLLDFMQSKTFLTLSLVTFLQFGIGVATLLMFVPISVASLHQVIGCLLLLIYIRSLFFSVRVNFI